MIPFIKGVFQLFINVPGPNLLQSTFKQLNIVYIAISVHVRTATYKIAILFKELSRKNKKPYG